MTNIPNGIRFAPSPTGRFHVGNLRTAWIASEFARSLGEPLVVRIEDIDAPRVLKGADLEQLKDMAQVTALPDQTLRQTDFLSRHFLLFKEAVAEGQVYPCDCSRKEVQAELANLASAPHTKEAIYTGHCRKREPDETLKTAVAESVGWRFAMPDSSGHDDFVIARTSKSALQSLKISDFVPAYHWACAIDDFDGNYRLLVRAWDLEGSAKMQRSIQNWLYQRERRTPIYPAIFHTALVVTDSGGRLEKRTQGVTLPELAAQGLSAEDLVSLFTRSFNDLNLRTPAPGELFGESNRTIALSTLGINPV